METATEAQQQQPQQEVTVHFYAIDPDAFLDGLLACEPHVVARIMDSVRAGDLMDHRCPGARTALVYWMTSAAPPLPAGGVASHDPRTCGATWTALAKQMTAAEVSA